jgi:hypothetical protein
MSVVVNGSDDAPRGFVEFKSTVTIKDTEYVLKLTGAPTFFVKTCIFFLAWRRALLYGFVAMLILAAGIMRMEDCKAVKTDFSCENCNITYFTLEGVRTQRQHVDIDTRFSTYDMAKCVLHETHIHRPIKGVLIFFNVALSIGFVVELVVILIDITGSHTDAGTAGRRFWGRARRVLHVLIDFGGQVSLVGTLTAIAYHLLTESGHSPTPDSAQIALRTGAGFMFFFTSLYVLMFGWTVVEAWKNHGVQSTVEEDTNAKYNTPDESAPPMTNLDDAANDAQAGNVMGAEKHVYFEMLHWAEYMTLFATIATLALVAGSVVNSEYPYDANAQISGNYPTLLTITDSITTTASPTTVSRTTTSSTTTSSTTTSSTTTSSTTTSPTNSTLATSTSPTSNHTVTTTTASPTSGTAGLTDLMDVINDVSYVYIAYSGNSTLLHTLQHHRESEAKTTIGFAWASFILNVISVSWAIYSRKVDKSIKTWIEFWDQKTNMCTFLDNKLIEIVFYASWVAGSLSLTLYLLGASYIVLWGWVPHNEAMGVGSVVVGSLAMLAAVHMTICLCSCLGGAISSTTGWKSAEKMDTLASRMVATKAVPTYTSYDTTGWNTLRHR